PGRACAGSRPAGPWGLAAGHDRRAGTTQPGVPQPARPFRDLPLRELPGHVLTAHVTWQAHGSSLAPVVSGRDGWLAVAQGLRTTRWFLAARCSAAPTDGRRSGRW